MLLSSKQIQFLLERIAEKTVVAPTKEFPYKISVRQIGYSPDREIGQLQAKLSIMLEVALSQEAK